MPRGVPGSGKAAEKAKAAEPVAVALATDDSEGDAPSPLHEAQGFTSAVEGIQRGVLLSTGADLPTGGPVSFVTREEHDDAVKVLRNEIGDLKQLVDDLNNIITAPVGSVAFTELTPTPGPAQAVEHVPDYQPEHTKTSSDGASWYQPDPY